MRQIALATVSEDDGTRFAALVDGERAVPLGDLARPPFGLPIEGAPSLLGVLEAWERNWPSIERAASLLDGDAAARGLAMPLGELQVHAPLVPRQVFCTGANYRKHVIGLIMGDPSMRGPDGEKITDPLELRRHAESIMDERARSGQPYCFVKLSSCVVGPYDPVVLPRNVRKADWELELGVVIGRRARHVRAADAMSCVAGFAIANDLTAREHVFRRDVGALGADWLSGKCFPTFLPFGPWIVPRQCVADPYALTIRLAVNGRVYQNESTSDMLLSIERQIEYLSERVELLPGDLICTGSPAGNGSAFGVYLKPGDVMEGSITGLGTQRNSCVAEPG